MKATDDEKWDEINANSKKSESEMDQEYRRFNGCYYTDLNFAKKMVDDLFSNMAEKNIKKIAKLKFLEPCVGTGNFVIAYLQKLLENGINNGDAEEAINNIYVCDTNDSVLDQYKTVFGNYVKNAFGITLHDDYFQKHVGRSLLFDLNANKIQYMPITDTFSGNDHYDIIMTNPPYKNLKAEKDQFHDDADYEKIKAKYAEVSCISKKIFRYSTSGVLNLYKLFVEEIIEKYAKNGTMIGLLIPSTMLSDKTCEKIRSRIIDTCKIFSVDVIGEDSSIVDAQQGLCALSIEKGLKNDIIKINKNFTFNNNIYTKVEIEDIINKKTGNAIIAVNENEYRTLKKLRCFPTVSDHDFIHNMRGEFDLTEYKSMIRGAGQYKLLRGRNIKSYVPDYDSGEYADSKFVDSTAKKKYVLSERIACQQISNMLTDQRLIFSLIEPGTVLANSCNFITVDSNDCGIDLYVLLGLFNSSIVNWLFKLTSSNNHINNYEIDALPIPFDKKLLQLMSETVRQFIKTHDDGLLSQIEKISNELYCINEEKTIQKKKESGDEITKNCYTDLHAILEKVSVDDVDSILCGKKDIDTYLTTNYPGLDDFNTSVCKNIVKKYVYIKNNLILNHTSFKLSDLDLEMIRNVPQGGNWKDIPQEVKDKSQRLLQIQASGGRTTLYGRIDEKLPSYTISTYFNRPGNGTFVHPIRDRVLSPREAARFQSFEDNYFFTGMKGRVTKQIGNAVPPMMAMCIAKEIIEKTGFTKTLDLFCGAGGMTNGFKKAGMQSIMATDFDVDACVTCKVNNPEIPVLCGDITDPSVKDEIINVAKNEGCEIVCGGPPCQGFSLAGKRFIDDPRNQLFKHFVEVVSEVNPKIVVMENVEGILTFDKGNVYKQILDLFSSLGYSTEGRVLSSLDYGVPQKRKRVIIIGVKSCLNIPPADLYPRKVTVESKNITVAKDVLCDLYNVDCGDDAKYPDVRSLPLYIQEMRGLETYGFHLKTASGVWKKSYQATLL